MDDRVRWKYKYVHSDARTTHSINVRASDVSSERQGQGVANIARYSQAVQVFRVLCNIWQKSGIDSEAAILSVPSFNCLNQTCASNVEVAVS